MSVIEYICESIKSEYEIQIKSEELIKMLNYFFEEFLKIYEK